MDKNFIRFGLLGKSLKHSFSPYIHNEIFKILGIEASYSLLEVKECELEDFIREFKNMKYKGINITIPYKVDIMRYLDHISIEAKRIGAVNTIAFRDGEIFGHNTDYDGFGMSLKREKIDIKNKKVIILGTGGASKAVYQYLIDNDAKDIVFVSRNPDKSSFNRVISYEELTKTKGDILINCTPCGMHPKVELCLIKIETIDNFNIIIDLIYNPNETVFLKESRKLGKKSVNGLYMLVGQAVVAQQIWNDIKISESNIDRIYDDMRGRFI